MAETATRRRNGTAPEHGAATKPKSARGGTRGPANKPAAAAGGGATKTKTKPGTSRPGNGSGGSAKGSSGPAKRAGGSRTGTAGARKGATSSAKPSTGSSKRSGGSGGGATGTAKRPASSPKRSAAGGGGATRSSGASKPSAGPVKRGARKAVDVAEELTPSASKAKHPVRAMALAGIKRTAKSTLSGALTAGAGVIRAAADRAAATGHEAVENTAHKRLPIQRSVDIAVPIRVAWEEWMALDVIPEGVHTVTEIERDGSELTGRTNGAKSTGWAAEILDERPEQSFAWQSHEGSDCAGLITFHELSRRLTRLELNLDVVPTGPLESAQLAIKLADRRAEAELRRFKARLELINPDLYEEDDEEDEDGQGDEDEHHDRDEADTDQDDGAADADDEDAEAEADQEAA